MKNKLKFLPLFILIMLIGCSTASNINANDYSGIYESSKNALNRFILEFKDGLYHIRYFDPENEWEGVGYDRDGRIVAVLRHLEEEDDAEFLVISFPGNDQLFVVARNLEGDYLRDEYFQRAD